jgi:hypothetical protein
MAYHETFWLAVTATAPVIALATTVSVSESLKLMNVGDEEIRYRVSMLVSPALFLSFMNMLLQLIFLFNALFSIAQGRDLGGVNLAPVVWGEPAGIALLLATAILNVVASARSQIKVDRDTATTKDARAKDKPGPVENK